MLRKAQNPTPKAPQDNNDTVHITFDLDFKFYASPQAKQLLQWLNQAPKWLLPFLLTLFTMHTAVDLTPSAAETQHDQGTTHEIKERQDK
jgi:hypothetical protein